MANLRGRSSDTAVTADLRNVIRCKQGGHSGKMGIDDRKRAVASRSLSCIGLQMRVAHANYPSDRASAPYRADKMAGSYAGGLLFGRCRVARLRILARPHGE